MGRLRWTKTLVHSTVSEVKANAFASIAVFPRVLEASKPPPTTPSKTTLLPVAAPRESSDTTQRSMPASFAGSQGAQEGAPPGRRNKERSAASAPAPAATLHEVHPER